MNTGNQIQRIIESNPEIQFGKPVFKGTRVPVQSLFWHLEEGYSIDQFIENFPSVEKKQVEDLLEMTGNIFNEQNMN
jgi:uncharacterized protein (DUF433 family)